MSGPKSHRESDSSESEYVSFRVGGKSLKRRIRHPGVEDWVETFDRIPIIDFTDIYHPDMEARRRLAMKLATAAENVGFWYAANVPMDAALIKDTFKVVENFFSMPTEMKMEVSWDETTRARGYESFKEVEKNLGLKSGADTVGTRESFVMGDDITDPLHYTGPVPAGLRPENIWPPSQPEFKQALNSYYSALVPFSRGLLHLFALAMGLEEDALDGDYLHPICTLRALHYPSQKTETAEHGFVAHADFSLFTLVLQGTDYAPGLEVLNANGHWIPAPYSPGTTFTCNVGDYLQRLSSGRFRSTVHRVINRSAKERYSLAFFWSPSPSAVIVPLPNPEGLLEGNEHPYTSEPFGKEYARRLLSIRPQHPTRKWLEELNIPEAEWDFSHLRGLLQ